MKYGEWTPKEVAALRRATAKLRAAQKTTTTGHKGIYWCNTTERFKVYLLQDIGKIYCGEATTIEQALRLQNKKERGAK